MKRYKEFITEASNKKLSLEADWFSAILYENIDKMKKILDKGFDINTKDEVGDTGLIFTVNFKPLNKSAEFLLKQPGIDINLTGEYERTPLLYAIQNGYGEIIKMLLSQPEIDITIKDYDNDDVISFLNGYDREMFINDYPLQKKIIENGRVDIIKALDDCKGYTKNRNYIHPQIRKEYPDLFKAKNWGLI